MAVAGIVPNHRSPARKYSGREVRFRLSLSPRPQQPSSGRDKGKFKGIKKQELRAISNSLAPAFLIFLIYFFMIGIALD